MYFCMELCLHLQSLRFGSLPQNEMYKPASPKQTGDLGVRPQDAQAAVGSADYCLCSSPRTTEHKFNFPRTLGLCR